MAQIGRPRTNDTATHCENDHELTPENTYVYPPGSKAAGKRVCKVCRRNSQQRYKGRPVSGDVPVGVWNRNKTHCPQQHPYAKFGRRNNDGSRFCTICHRAGRIRRTYGLEPQQWDALVLEQEGRCAICLAEHGDLHVDHDHATGAARGLLCPSCNNGLGRFEDDPERLERGAAYVRHHRALYDQGKPEWLTSAPIEFRAKLELGYARYGDDRVAIAKWFNGLADYIERHRG